MIFRRTFYCWTDTAVKYRRRFLFPTDGFDYEFIISRSHTRNCLRVRQTVSGSVVFSEKYFLPDLTYHPMQIIGDYFLQVLGFCVEIDNNILIVNGNRFTFD